MWESLEQSGWVKVLGMTGWMYASVAVMHYASMFWFIGSMVFVDLRVAGLAAKKKSVTELADMLFPWAWIGFGLAVVSGFLMFATAAGDWAPDPVFHVKLTVIAISVVFAVIVQMGIPKWAQAPDIPTIAKIIAVIAILLWVASIVTSSEIPALEGLG